MRRREFIAGLGGAAAWSLLAAAQQGDRLRLVGVLMAATPRRGDEPLSESMVTVRPNGFIEPCIPTRAAGPFSLGA
jgi:hypothetical protein